MAKEKENKLLSPEEAKRQREKAELEAREKEEEIKRQKEKEQRKKDREKKEKKREQLKKKKIKAKNKRIKEELSFPFKLLFRLTLLITLLAFILIFFVLQAPIYDTLLYLFFIFTFFYLGAGGVMAGIYYMLAADKRKKLELQIEKELQEAEEEEKRKKEEELQELEALERSASERKDLQDSPPISLPGVSSENEGDETIELPESSTSIEDIPEKPSEGVDIPEQETDDSIPEFPAGYTAQAEDQNADDTKDKEDTPANNMSDEEAYIAEILGDDFKK